MQRRPPRNNLFIRVPHKVRVGLMRAAKQRGLTLEQLALVLLSVLVTDNLIAAVLDDAQPLDQPRQVVEAA
jgi:hypothetical protein